MDWSQLMDGHQHPILVIALIAVLAPLISELPFRFRLPSVVLEIVLGIVVGPQVLNLVRVEAVVDALWTVGLCFLFLMAGIEIDFSRLRGRPIQLATGGWVLSLALGIGGALLLNVVGLIGPPFLIAVALTTTAIGALLPILRDTGELPRKFGVLTLAAGAVGEFGPLLLLSLLPLSVEQSVENNALIVVAFAVVAVLAAAATLRVQPPRFVAMLKRHMYRSSQLPVRVAVLLMAALVVVAAELGLELLIGAFAAGLIIGMVARGEESEPFHHKLDGLGFGFLIPIFFVVTGVKFDLNALIGSTKSLLCVPLFLGLFLLVRGLPVLLYRRELGGRDRLALAFYSASALPVVVAITQVGVETKQIEPGIAAALVGAGMISLLLFPQIAMTLRAHSHVGEEIVPDAQHDPTP
ncbi:MAG: sodium:proton exchanger [Planctomycetaceae bacterium]|nr:sodium:proton exchanger [Planctomycetaceae bacterium]